MNILQINVRLNEGGAAGVALDLHRRIQLQENYSSSYLYGYGKGAKPNTLDKYLKASHIGSRAQVGLNYLSYKVLNWDIIYPVGSLKRKLIEYIEIADIIHLHVIHSHFLSFSWLVNLLVMSRKKVVWTIHDYWIVTGRCAITDNCSQWRNDCKSCSTLTNYPPVMIDRARHILPKKRNLVKKLADIGCVYVSPSKHLFKDIQIVYPNMDIRVINNALDIETELIAESFNSLRHSRDSKEIIRVLVIAHDLSYNGKTNIKLINKIKDTERVELHTIGKNSPFFGNKVVNYGYIEKKKELYKIYQNIDVMVFSSIVDNFPLVIGEALSIGVPVIASSSVAANEVLSLVGGKAAASSKEIIDAFIENNWMGQFYSGQTIEKVKDRAIAMFSGERLLNEYLSIYNEV